jgi:MFS family permease
MSNSTSSCFHSCPCCTSSMAWTEAMLAMPKHKVCNVTCVDFASTDVISGFTTDIGVKSSDLNFAVSLFFVTFVVFQPISSAVGRRIGAKNWIPFIMVWSESQGPQTILILFAVLLGYSHYLPCFYSRSWSVVKSPINLWHILTLRSSTYRHSTFDWPFRGWILSNCGLLFVHILHAL